MCSRNASRLAGFVGALLTSCAASEGPRELTPTIERIEPPVGYSLKETPVVIRGNLPVKPEVSYSGHADTRIDARYRAWIGGVELVDVRWIDAASASALVPAGLAPGVHALVLESPFGTRAAREAAFTVLPGGGATLQASAVVSPARISVGQRATLALTVENAGSGDVRAFTAKLEVLAGASSMRDLSPAPAPQDVPAGGSATFTWTFTGAAAGELSLAIDGSGKEATSGTTLTMPRATAAATVQTPPALVTTASVAPKTSTVGQAITVTAAVRNDGLATAAGVGAEVSSSFSGLGSPDATPALQDIPGGQSVTFTWTYHPTAPSSPGGATLSVSAAGNDANSGARVTAAPATTDFLVNAPAMVSANLEAPAQVTASQTIAVTLTVTNTGSAPARVTPIIDDPTSSGTATVSPSSGSTLPTTQIDASASQAFTWEFVSAGSGTITFSARVAWRDVNGGQVGTANTSPVTVQVLRPASLVISSATASPPIVPAGQELTVTAVVVNGGESTVTGATATISAAPAGFTETSAPAPQDVPGGGSITRTFTWKYTVGSPAAATAFSITVAGTDENSHQPVSAPPRSTNAVVAAYPVGGTVIGLTGAGLRLKNGTEVLSVAAGATSFTFQDAIPSGSTYDATVEADPTSQTCTVANGSGTVGTTPVTGIIVSCAMNPAAQLVFAGVPATGTAGHALAPPFRVELRDARGDLTDSTAPVTVEIASGPAGATISGTPVVAAVGGIATFSNVILDKAGTYRLRAASGALGADSENFTVSAGPPAQLAFVQQPTSTASGQPISPAPTVELLDAFGNRTSDVSLVSITVASGPSTTLSGTTTTAAVAGLASFPGLTLDLAGSYTLRASSGTLPFAISAAFDVSASAPTQLVLVRQPTTGVAGQPLSPALQFELRDLAGNLTASSASVALEIAAGPPDATISGTRSVAAVAGVATFSNVLLERAGAHTLRATSGALDALTGSITISAAEATRLVFVPPQPTSAVAGVALSPAPTVELRDQFGNLTSSTALVSVTLAAGPTGATLSGTTAVPAVAGRATFADLALDLAGRDYVLLASCGTLASDSSSPFDVVAGVPAGLAFVQQPIGAPVGKEIKPPPSVEILDAFANRTASTASVTLVIASGPQDARLSGDTTVAAVAGLATFGGLSLDIAGTYTLQAVAVDVTASTSASFEISAAR